MNYDLSVAWRIYPKVSRTPIVHTDNKYELVKTCLKSFISCVINLKVKYFFVLDGCPSEYKSLLETLFDKNDLVIIETSSIGNELTFKKQIEILLNQNYSDKIYFAEDDYFYLPNTFECCINLLENKEVDFISLYQHSDTFTNNIHNHNRELKFYADQLWHTDSSTCLTFLTTKKLLRKTKNIFLTYCHGNFDVCIWLIITGTFFRNPFSYIQFYLFDRSSFWILKTAFKKGFKFIFIPKKYNLWIPYPALATHLEKDFISPKIDWVKKIAEFEAKFTN